MSVLIFIFTFISLVLFVWILRKITKCFKKPLRDQEQPSPTPNENIPMQTHPPTLEQLLSMNKIQEGRRLSGISAHQLTHHKPPYFSQPSSMRRASMQNGAVRVRSSSGSRVVPTSRPSSVPRHHPLMPITGGTVQIEVPVVVMVPSRNLQGRPVTVLYGDPPPPFDEEPPPPYEAIFGSSSRIPTNSKH